MIEKDKYCVIPLTEVPRVVKFMKTKENRDYRAGRARELLLNGYRVLVG